MIIYKVATEVAKKYGADLTVLYSEMLFPSAYCGEEAYKVAGGMDAVILESGEVIPAKWKMLVPNFTGTQVSA